MTEQSDSGYFCTVCRREVRDNEALPCEWRGGEQGGHDYSRRALALVLAWEGEVCAEGVFRAWDRWGPDEDREFAATDESTYDVLGEALDSLRGCEWLARACGRVGLGEVVVLDGEAPRG
jgi:hypothetical protein